MKTQHFTKPAPVDLLQASKQNMSAWKGKLDYLSLKCVTVGITVLSQT